MPKFLSQIVGMVGTTSTGFSISVSGRNSTSGRVSTFGIVAELRSPCTYDLRTMVNVVSVRLTSPERVTAGVGTSSRAADTEIDSPDRLLRSTLHVGTVSMVFLEFYG